MERKQIFLNRDIGFYSGMALATPFLASIVPSIILYVSLIFLIPFFAVFVLRVRKINLEYINPLIICFLFLGCAHLIALVVTGTPFWIEGLRGIFSSFLMIFIYLVGRKSSKSDISIYNGFVAALIPAGLFFAVFSLIKLFLLQRGILIPYLGTPYPPDGSLKSDYNIFGFTMLLCALISLARLLYGNRKKIFLYITLVQTSLFSIAAFAAGARRIIILTPVMLLASFFFWVLRSGGIKLGRFFLIFGAVIGVVAGTFAVISIKPILHLLGTMGPDNFMGFISRVDRWAMSFELLAKQQYFIPMGFSYHTLYSCKFNNCMTIDYPHLTIVSEWLALGVVGLIVSLAVYFLLWRLVWASSRLGVETAMSFVAIAIIPHSIISGDNLLSNPQFMAVLLVLSSICEHRKISFR